MGNLSKTKSLFSFTSPRSIEKIIPEIKILVDNFEGQEWSGNEKLQIVFFQKLFDSEFYQGEIFPSNPALAARDRITRSPKALGFVDLKPQIKLTPVGHLLLEGKRLDELFTRQLLKFQLPSPYHTQSKTVDFNVKPYLELLRLIKEVKSISKTEIALFFSQLTHYEKFDEIVVSILNFRKNSKAYKGSRKMYVQEQAEKIVKQLFDDEITSKNLKTRESTDTSLQKFLYTKIANMKDYADAFIRYIRATELVTFQRKKLRLVISSQKTEEVDYILKTVSLKSEIFKTESDFKAFLFNPISIKLLSDDRELLIKKINNLNKTKVNKKWLFRLFSDFSDSKNKLLF